MNRPEGVHTAAETTLEPFTVNVRIKISALWTAMLFVFAYVDLFSLYRRDFHADLEAGEVNGFTINQWFLLGTTVYVVIPSLMVFVALILRPRASRIANFTLGIVYALTIITGAIGEWGYYILGSAIEVALLASTCRRETHHARGIGTSAVKGRSRARGQAAEARVTTAQARTVHAHEWPSLPAAPAGLASRRLPRHRLRSTR